MPNPVAMRMSRLRRITLLAAIILCVAANASLGAAPTRSRQLRREQPTRGPTSLVAWWGDRDTIFRKATALTAGAEPALSPDGRRVAFIQNATSLWLWDLKTSKATLLRRCGNAHSPTWDPTGRQIAFTGNPGSWDETGTHILPPTRVRNLDSYGIWVIQADGRGLHKLPSGSSEDQEDQYPLWSPDGRWIAWTRGKRIWITDTSGVARRPLTAVPASRFEFPLSWSADGGELLYAASDGSGGSEYELRLIRPDGTAQRRDPTGLVSFFPQGVRWSPDGTWLLCALPEGVSLIEHRAGGRSRTLMLTSGHPSVGQMAISRDQRIVVYENGDPEGEELLSIIRLR